ncbi:MAG: phage head-tail adapter protein [Ruminiclostridium sp.]|nr:phage head-tail adapter protein [Ruminiclostridium sp.]MDE6724776.1 phage head-tail adapter protein [Ruminiclostridium sp.]
MNKEWSELNKKMQTEIKKESTFCIGIETLLQLRRSLFEEIHGLKKELDRENFNAIPFMNAEGYHNKTIAYSIWHIFRIEDIVTHTLICADSQIFFSENYQKRIGSPIITTGNELEKQQIADFSKVLDLEELYKYVEAVKVSTENILKNLSFADLKRKISDSDKERLISAKSVSDDEKANWLIDYWCGKDIRGLIQMPLSRHWIMHVEASLRIKDNMLCR